MKSLKEIQTQITCAQDSLTSLNSLFLLFELAEAKAASEGVDLIATLLALLGEKFGQELDSLAEHLEKAKELLATPSDRTGPPPVPSRQPIFGVGARVRCSDSKISEAKPQELGTVRGVFFQALTEEWLYAVKWDRQTEEDFADHIWYREKQLA